MKGLSDQRRLYALSAVLLALTVAVCCVWGVWGKGNEDGAEALPTPGAVETPVPWTAEGERPVSEKLVSTVVYFQDNYGYLVPVMKTIASQPGVARATLEMMVDSPANDMEAARLGLRPVIPENTKLDLDISGGTATLDMSREADSFTDAAAERNMVEAIVQTLTEFPTVDQVKIRVAGREKDSLQCGTAIGGALKRDSINLEGRDDGLLPSQADVVTLYFAGETGSVIVPVSRMVYGKGDVETAVVELIKGPSAMSPLENPLPSGCGLIGVKQENGHVVVNFTREFLALFENEDGGRQALRALALTCAQFDGVQSVEIQVEGVTYDVGGEALALPTFVNVESVLAEEAILAQARALVDGDE